MVEDRRWKVQGPQRPYTAREGRTALLRFLPTLRLILGEGFRQDSWMLFKLETVNFRPPTRPVYLEAHQGV